LSNRNISGFGRIGHPNITAGVSKSSLRRTLIDKAHNPADLKLTEELSGTVCISEVKLDWCSHRDVSALNVIEEILESTIYAHNCPHEQIIVVIRSSSVAAIGFQVDGVLGGRSDITISKGRIGFKVIGVPKFTSLDSWRLASDDSDRLTGRWCHRGPLC
jgi:hypothetical protein